MVNALEHPFHGRRNSALKVDKRQERSMQLGEQALK
jgi:hypothetical protein